MFLRSVRALALGVVLLGGAAVAVANEAADFSVRDLNNRPVSLTEYKGKVIVMSFWATWCGPCKEEMPHLEKMYKAYQDQGLVVLSISADDARAMSQVKGYIRSKGYTFPVWLDPTSTAVGLYNPGKTLPYTVVIDRNFQIAHQHTGYTPGDEVELEARVKKLLGIAE
jgi:thiol-disulfide isomerase/thioredoxin